jgi:cytochrome P450
MVTPILPAPLAHPHRAPIYAPGLRWLGPARAFFRDPLNFHVEAYRQCGPVYRITLLGRTTTVLAGLEANRFVWENDALWDFGVTGAIFRENFGNTYLTQLDGEAHAKKRRRMQAGFKPQALLALAPAMSETMMAELKDVSGRVVDLRLLCSRLIVCLSSRALLQVRLPEGLDARIAAFEHDLLFGGRLPSWLRHWWYRRKKYLRLKAELVGYIEHMLEAKRLNPPAVEDLISIMVRHHPAEEPPLTHDEIVTDAALLFLAGSNTTSSVVLWSLLFVYTRPDWLARLREELADWDPAHFTGMAAYPRLRATVLEAERLRPALPFAIRCSRREFAFQGYAFPAGSRILHATAVTHFLAEHYERPLEFLPERFLPDRSPPPKVHGTFGGGTHVCLGQPLARVQEPLMLANFVRHYDLEFARPPSLQPRLGAVVTPADAALPVRIVPR